MKHEFIDLGPLADFPEDRPVLRKEGARRFACVRRGGEVHAIDDRCPHQGYPLSQGSVRDGVLTCEWHNWKFDLATGACTFGGEPVRRYPTRVQDGRVHLDAAVDTAGEARRLVAGLRAALLEDGMGRALREGLRLGELGIHPPDASGLGPLYVAFEVVARDGAERAEYGFDHGLAVLADLCSWVERGTLAAEEAFVAGCHAVAEPSLHLGPRVSSRARRSDPSALVRIADFEAGDPGKVSDALLFERRDEAEARIRALVEIRGPEVAHEALLPFVARHLYDYGHGAIFLTKALELARRFPAVAADLLAASTVQLSWATAETSLPPFAATRSALDRLVETKLPSPRPVAWDRTRFEADVLAGEKTALAAVLARLEEGCDPIALLRAIGHAAAVRLARFDPAWEDRLDAEVSILDVTHAVTFTEAVIALAPKAPPRELAQLVLIAAAFVGKLHHADAAELTTPDAKTRAASLAEAAAARDLGRAIAIVKEMGAAERQNGYSELGPFAAFDAAIRPIFYAHTVKNTEALRRLEAGDEAADGAYLEALVRYIVPARRELRVRRTAAVAKKFLRDGRPPEGLY